MPENYFRDIRARRNVKPADAITWVKKCIVGNIRKHELDNERMRETNALDMMQNSSIIYHTESILEMQICCLIAMILLTEYWSEVRGYGAHAGKPTSLLLMYALIGEHLFSYIFGIFRNYDLKHNGEKNKHGIESAPTEKKLRFLEIIVDLAISIWILVAMLS